MFRAAALVTADGAHTRISLRRGARTHAEVEPGEVFRAAIADNANALITWQTHPSGTPTPSDDDINLTRQLAAAGRSLDIHISDHLVSPAAASSRCASAVSCPSPEAVAARALPRRAPTCTLDVQEVNGNREGSDSHGRRSCDVTDHWSRG